MNEGYKCMKDERGMNREGMSAWSTSQTTGFMCPETRKESGDANQGVCNDGYG